MNRNGGSLDFSKLKEFTMVTHSRNIKRSLLVVAKHSTRVRHSEENRKIRSSLIGISFFDHINESLSGDAFIELVKHTDECFYTLNLVILAESTCNFVDFN